MAHITRSPKVGVIMAMILRHRPEEHNVNMMPDGSVLISEISEALTRWFHTEISTDDILWQIENDSKGRYGFEERNGKTWVFAYQGHSFEIDHNMTVVDVEMIQKMGRNCFHGTKQKFMESINEKGLIPRSRTFVHLSKDKETAQKVGDRRKGSNTVIIVIDMIKLIELGKTIYLSENNVLLVDSVPIEAFVSIS